MVQHSIILYTRAGCHLCEDALVSLRRQGLEPELVDIDKDKLLADKFGDCVPVVEIDGRVRFRGRLNEVLLRRVLESGR